MFLNHNRIKLNIRKIARKSPNTWKLNNTLLNSTWVKNKSQEKFLNILENIKIGFS